MFDLYLFIKFTLHSTTVSLIRNLFILYVQEHKIKLLLSLNAQNELLSQRLNQVKPTVKLKTSEYDG